MKSPNKYRPEVVLIGEESSKYVEKTVADTVLYFSAQTPEDILPKVGDILSCGVCQELPYGLANRVISIDRKDDAIECVTAPAALNEVFSDLKLYSSIRLNIGQNSDVAKATIGNPEILTINLDNKSDDDKGAFVSGTTTVGAFYTTAIDLAKNKSESSLELLFDLGCEFGASEGLENTMALLPRKVLLQTVVELGPLVLRPFMSLAIDAKFSTEGSFTVGYSKSLELKPAFVAERALSKIRLRPPRNTIFLMFFILM